MSSTPRTPAEHYAEAARLLAAAESSRTAEIQSVDALIALGHAVLATVPKRRARQRQIRQAPAGFAPRPGGSPRQRWLDGDDETGAG